jgi:hypothetical protein
MTIDTQKAEAEGLRIALTTGVVGTDKVILWADQIIEREAKPDVAIIEVALAAARPIDEIARLLEQVPGETDRVFALRTVMRDLLGALEADPSSAELVAQKLYRLAATGEWPEQEFGVEAFWLDDTFDLVRTGTYRGKHEDAVKDLRDFLSRNS